MPQRLALYLIVGTTLCLAVACGDTDSTDELTPSAIFDACTQTDHPARRTNHADVGQIDHCPDELPEYAHLLTNWGTRPEWLSETELVFLSNHMGHVWKMNVFTGELDNLTDHFDHAGFTRAFRLANGDLLLLGLLEGEALVDEPLVEHSSGRFDAELFVLQQPFNGEPIPLGEHAWEGIAVSRETLRIAWSNTNEPFWHSDENGEIDWTETALAYLREPSELVTAVISHDADGLPLLTDRRTVLANSDAMPVGPVFLEPQNFIGPGDERLLVSAYGPVGNGSDLLIVKMDGSGFERVYVPGGEYYEEWESVDPTSNRAFIEIDWDAQLFPSASHLVLYSFDDQSLSTFATPDGESMRVSSGAQNPVFSANGRWVLANTRANGDLPGYGAGMVLFDVQAMPPLPAAVAPPPLP